MDVRQLRHFIAVCDAGGFGAAARELDVSQQALSQSIARLETELGTRLFDRDSKTAMNRFGRELRRHATVVLAELDRAERAVHALRDAHAGEIRLGVGESFAGAVAPAAIAALHSRHPDIRIHLVEGYSEALLDQLASGKLDLVVGAPPATAHGRSGIGHEPLFQDRDVVAVRRGHPLAAAGALAITDLSAYPWIVGTYSGETHELICQAFVDAGAAPPTEFVFADAVATGIGLLSAGDYLILVPRGMISPLLDAGALAELDVTAPTRQRVASIWTRRESPVSPATAALIDQIRQSADRWRDRAA